MTVHQDQIDISLFESIFKPTLLDRLFYRDNERVIVIASKIKDEAKSKDPNALVLRLELSIPLCKRLTFPGLRVDDVKIRGQIVRFEIWYCMIKFAICRFCLIKFVVARADQVDALLLCDFIREFATWLG